MSSAAFNVSVTTALQKFFDAANDGGKCTEFAVTVEAGSAAPVLVNVPGLHKPGEYYEVQAGQTMLFRLGPLGIAEVYFKTSADTATISYGVTAKMFGSGTG